MRETDAGPSRFTSKLAAVLVADAVGYSRLMSQDAEATVRTLDAARTVFQAQVQLHAGRVIDMAGDSIMAVFETALGAVKAATIAMRQIAATNQGLSPSRVMQFRVGLNLGDLIEKADGTAYGDGINIAARLQCLAKPGEIVLSDAVYAAIRGNLPMAFTDYGEHHVKNIGYPIRCYKAQLDPSAAAIEAKGTLTQHATPKTPQKPSIAVLPLNNMSGDPEQTIFSDGISEDVITELSRFKSLHVIARNSSFTYKGTYPDIRVVGRELGVRFVLEGSVRKSRNKLRVSAQLMDTTIGTHVWAEKYDRELEDVFELQEELTRHIVGAIAPEIMAIELAEAQRRAPESLSAHDLSVKARSQLWQASVTSDTDLRESAIVQARSALTLDPRNVLAWGLLAQGMRQRICCCASSDPIGDWQAGMSAAQRAIDLDPADSLGYECLGGLQGLGPHTHALEEALLSLRHAYKLNPNEPSIVASLGDAETSCGHPEVGITLLTQALGMNPRDPHRHVMRLNLARAYLLTDKYALCTELCREAISDHPESTVARLLLAAGCAAMGHIEQAQSNFEAAQSAAPEMTRAHLAGEVRFSREADRVRYSTLLNVAAGMADAAEAAKVCSPQTPAGDTVAVFPKRRSADAEQVRRRASDKEARRRRASDQPGQVHPSSDEPAFNRRASDEFAPKRRSSDAAASNRRASDPQPETPSVTDAPKPAVRLKLVSNG